MIHNLDSPITVKNSGKILLKKINDKVDGNLIILEESKDIPFEIKRVYYITNLEKNLSVRGKHAHKELHQVIFCISGSFVLGLDDGIAKQNILMDREDIGILLGPGLWHTMEQFSDGCIILVIASDYYDESDYIRDYDKFIEFTLRKK